MIEIGQKRLLLRRVRVKDVNGKHKMLPKIVNGEPVEELIAHTVSRVTRGELNGHFCRDSGRKLVATFKDGDILELRPQGCRKGIYAATLFDIYSWMIRAQADNARMAKLRELKAKKEEARRLRALRRKIEQS